LDKAVEDWEDKPEADQTVDNAITHFTRADDNRCEHQANMMEVLTANTAISNSAQPKWGPYCWSHGMCTHTSAECNIPAPGHCKEATLQNIRGGLLSMTKPPGYTAVYKPKPYSNNWLNQGNNNCDKKKEQDQEPTKDE
jgi:hypothetical protein